MEKNVEKSALECISFSIANTSVLIERRHVIGMTLIHNENSNLEIKPIEEVLGLPPITELQDQKKSILSINIGNGKLNLQVNDPVEIIELKERHIHPLPRLLASRIKLSCIRAIAIIKESVGIIIDPLKIIE